MKPFLKGLDNETQLLVAAGAAVAAGCIPCLKNLTHLAEAEGIDLKKMKSAAIIGQYIKEQPAAHMKEAADSLLGTHLQAAEPEIGCPADSRESASGDNTGLKNACGCQQETR